MNKRILTGDRPTGNLHLGHYFGTLINRVKFQDEYDTIILIADLQVLTDHLPSYPEIEPAVFGLMCDYLGVGLKPTNTFVVQSQVPELAELTNFFSYLATVARLQRNPTLKSESKMYGVSNMSMGFLMYPISQAADILAFRAHLVPVGQDQMPHIELTREIARSFNRIFENEVFPEPEGLVGNCPVLVGIDGENKMSKSLRNYIAFAHTNEETIGIMRRVVTDRSRIHTKDPGHPNVCTAFKYWCLFNPTRAKTVSQECQSAIIGCKNCKQELTETINQHLAPIRALRNEYANNPDVVWKILRVGTQRARDIASDTLKEVRKAMRLDYQLLHQVLK